jgi:hypothetical protein
MSRSVSPEKAARVLGSLPEEIEASEAVTEALARAILQQARRAAQLRPTPQAEMAAEGLGVRGDTPCPGVPLPRLQWVPNSAQGYTANSTSPTTQRGTGCFLLPMILTPLLFKLGKRRWIR